MLRVLVATLSFSAYIGRWFQVSNKLGGEMNWKRTQLAKMPYEPPTLGTRFSKYITMNGGVPEYDKELIIKMFRSTGIYADSAYWYRSIFNKSYGPFIRDVLFLKKVLLSYGCPKGVLRVYRECDGSVGEGLISTQDITNILFVNRVITNDTRLGLFKQHGERRRRDAYDDLKDLEVGVYFDDYDLYEIFAERLRSKKIPIYFDEQLFNEIHWGEYKSNIRIPDYLEWDLYHNSDHKYSREEAKELACRIRECIDNAEAKTCKSIERRAFA